MLQKFDISVLKLRLDISKVKDGITLRCIIIILTRMKRDLYVMPYIGGIE